MCLSVVLLALAAVLGEVASLALLGSFTDGLTVLVTLLAAAGVGALLLSGRAIATLRAAGVAVAKREPVTPVLFEGALVAVAGLLFIVPGLLSDVVAIALLVPRWRGRAAERLTARLSERVRARYSS